MIVTDANAIQKRCCGPNGTGLVANDSRTGSPDNQERWCIGALCMGWRWIPGRPAMTVWNYRTIPMSVETQIPATPPTRGYCGLAGPELS